MLGHSERKRHVCAPQSVGFGARSVSRENRVETASRGMSGRRPGTEVENLEIWQFAGRLPEGLQPRV